MKAAAQLNATKNGFLVKQVYGAYETATHEFFITRKNNQDFIVTGYKLSRTKKLLDNKIETLSVDISGLLVKFTKR